MYVITNNHNRNNKERKDILELTIPDSFHYNPNMFIEPQEQAIHHKRLISISNKHHKVNPLTPDNGQANTQSEKSTNSSDDKLSLSAKRLQPTLYESTNKRICSTPTSSPYTNIPIIGKHSSSTNKIHTTMQAPVKKEINGLLCSICKKSFAHASSLSRHIGKQHKQMKGSIQCNKCDER